MRRKGEVTALEISVKSENTRVGMGGEWARQREVREWGFLFEGIMFGWMRLREGEGQ